MTPLSDLLPQDKHDEAAVERLQQLSDVEVNPLLPQLLEWLQDFNWPVASAVWKFLLPRVQALEPAILEVLAGTDDAWKSNLLLLVIHSELPALSAELREVVERIAHFPTASERFEDAADNAHDLLAKYA
jgi:MoxR-like ATPase